MNALIYAFAALLALTFVAPAAARDLPEGFVHLRDIDPSIAQDMRYAGADNFTGRPLPGYGAAECILRREAAEALARVQADLVRQNLGLKVYDCYRPIRAVRAMAQWASDRTDDAASERFHPGIDKRHLFAQGYIASRSRHSTGTAVDLTLVRLPVSPPPPFDLKARYGPCTAPAAERAPDNGLDMGTGFDCFDPRSHTVNAAIGAQAQRWRGLLTAAMRRHGFHHYFREWWHFSFAAAPARPQDFPITPQR
jgi:D-alanyl-D-alanine dipeptidase